MKWWLISAAVLTVIGWFPLIGLPGVIPFYLGYPLYDLFLGAGAFSQANDQLGDQAWPLALILSAIWPWTLPAAWKLSERFSKVNGHIESWLSKVLRVSSFLTLVIALLSSLGATS